jgi:8-oxo-dGTP pyrophosphatase MutT (NUDIX family)
VQDFSFGIVPLRQDHGIWEVFLVQHRAGHWTLPKGHAEGVETPLEAANRELFEETGLIVAELLFVEPLYERYMFRVRGQLIEKTVAYFLATVTGAVQLQQEEIRDGRWEYLHQAAGRVTFSGTKALLEKTIELLDDGV